MNVLLGYQEKQADPREAMMARMAAMMDRMEVMMDPALTHNMAAERASSRPDLHLITDTLTAMQASTEA